MRSVAGGCADCVEGKQVTCKCNRIQCGSLASSDVANAPPVQVASAVRSGGTCIIYGAMSGLTATYRWAAAAALLRS